MSVATELTAHQADQLERLQKTIEDFPRLMGRVCVCWAVGTWLEVPAVWSELAELGLVEITRDTEHIWVAPLRRAR